MARMTPEEEAAYALDFGVDRSGLREDVQLAYDRLVEQRRARAQARQTLIEQRAAQPGAALWLPAKPPPGRRWYWVFTAVLVVGVVGLVAGFTVAIAKVNSFPRVPDPGTGVLNLHAGSYVIYYEGSVPEVPAGFVNVKPLSATAAVGHISPYSSGLTYSVGSRSGVAVAILQITGPGRFLIRATGAPGVPAGHLAFGSDIAGWIPLVGAPFVVLGGAGVIGIIALAFTRRRRASPPWPAPVRGPS